MPASSRSCGSTESLARRATLPSTAGSTRSRWSRSPVIRIPVSLWPSRSVMSHHFDYPQNETLDISDAYVFDGAGNGSDPRTVFGMNTSPTYGKPWDPAGYYELKIDTNGDYVEDITYRATFPIGPDGTQHVHVVELRGAEATSRHARGTIITPHNAPVGEIVECSRGIKLFAGQRLDPFVNFIPNPVATAKALATGTFPDFNAL